MGEIVALISASCSDADSLRIDSNRTGRRNSGAGPLKTPGYFLPNILQNATHASNVKRRQINAALQWQASNDLEVYLDGLYTHFKNRDIDSGFNLPTFTTNVPLPDIPAHPNWFAVDLTRIV